MLVLTVISLACSFIYALAGLATMYGTLRTGRGRRLRDDQLPHVSVIVSARNEQRDLPACIASLAALDYPVDRLDVWLVDDRSTDGTAGVIAAACRTHAHFHALDTATFDTHLQAKARGVALAAKHAKGEWLFITDADAVVHPEWLRTMLGRADERTGILSGLFVTEPNTLVGVLERGTGLAALSISFGVEGLGAEVVPMGPNMAIRRAVYEAHGGLENVSFRIAEDIALWQLGQRAGMTVRAVLEPEATITVQPVPTLLHLVSQQRRWLVGGLGDGPTHIKLASLSVSIVALVGTVSTLVVLSSGAQAGLVALSFYAVSQLAGVSALRRRLGLRSVLRIAPIGLVYTMALFVWLPLSAFLLPVVHWRGEGYDVRFASDRAPGAS